MEGKDISLLCLIIVVTVIESGSYCSTACHLQGVGAANAGMLGRPLGSQSCIVGHHPLVAWVLDTCSCDPCYLNEAAELAHGMIWGQSAHMLRADPCIHEVWLLSQMFNACGAISAFAS